MPSNTPLTDAINALTRYANETTGQSDTTLSDAVGTLVAGYGGGGGSGEDYIQFKTTPSETALTVEYNAGSFTLGAAYAVFVHSTNSGNDPSHATIVDGGRYHLPYTEMGSSGKDFGRITTRKAGSGTDYWNNPYITVTQSGSTLTITGNNSQGWWMGGVEYSFYIQNFNDWASR